MKKRIHFSVKPTAVLKEAGKTILQYVKTRNGQPYEPDPDGYEVYHYATVKKDGKTGRLYAYFIIGMATRKVYLDTMPRYVVH